MCLLRRKNFGGAVWAARLSLPTCEQPLKCNSNLWVLSPKLIVRLAAKACTLSSATTDTRLCEHIEHVIPELVATLAIECIGQPWESVGDEIYRNTGCGPTYRPLWSTTWRIHSSNYAKSNTKNLTSQACFPVSHAHLNFPRYVFFGKRYTNPSNKSVSISYDDAQQLRQHCDLATLSLIHSKIVYVRYERICTLWPINVTFQCPLQFAYFMKTRETSSRPPKATTKGKHHCSPIKLYIRFIAR